jgi:hypothetical protein
VSSSEVRIGEGVNRPATPDELEELSVVDDVAAEGGADNEEVKP